MPFTKLIGVVPVSCKVPPKFVVAPKPKLAREPTESTPPVTETVPVIVLEPDSTSVPRPDLRNALFPESRDEKLNVFGAETSIPRPAAAPRLPAASAVTMSGSVHSPTPPARKAMVAPLATVSLPGMAKPGRDVVCNTPAVTVVGPE